MNTREEQIELVKKLLKTGVSDDARMVLEKQFPEVVESEDERIRKEIVEFICWEIDRGSITNEQRKRSDSWLSYLEKQKEQKPAEWSEDWREEDIQTRFAFYTYMDDPSVLYLSNVFVEEASRNHGFGTRILRAAEKVAEAIGATTISLKVKQDSPANAWYRKNGYGYVTFEDGYDWLEKNLEYMKPYKQEWSEDDDNTLEETIQSWLHEHDCKGWDKYGNIYVSMSVLRELVKSLRHQLGSCAGSFMNYLDNHRPEGKMCLSNGECANIDKAFKEISK